MARFRNLTVNGDTTITGALSVSGAFAVGGLISPVADLTAAKALAADAMPDKGLLLIESLGLYRVDTSSSAAADDTGVIRPTVWAASNGRLIRIAPIDLAVYAPEKLASTANAEGASLVGIEDALNLYTATEVEGALAEVKALADAAAVAATLASTANAEGASLIGVEDAAGDYDGTTVEAVLAEIPAMYASLANGKGASLVGVEDLAGVYAGDNVEECLAEVMGDHNTLISDLASTANGKGASMIGLEDTGLAWTGTNLETVMAEVAIALQARLLSAKLESKDVVIALGASSGASAADPDWVGATIIGAVPTAGNDKPLVLTALAGDGAVTLTLADVSTAEATWRVTALLA